MSRNTHPGVSNAMHVLLIGIGIFAFFFPQQKCKTMHRVMTYM